MRSVVPSLAVMFALILAPVQPALLAQLVQVQVTLTCSDGTEITDTLLVVDSAALAALQSAVEAMALYPAGLTCRLTQQLGASLGGLFAPLVAFAQSSGGNPVWNYTVGGGRAVISSRCSGEETNFGFSARVEPVSNGTPGQGQGTFNLTIPQCGSFNGSHLGTKVDCVHVNGSTANLGAVVTHATGVFADPLQYGFTENETRIGVLVIDSGVPGGTGDRIGWSNRAIESMCGLETDTDAPVDNGNVKVHQANP